MREAKDMISHGGWLPWLSENFEGSVRVAQNYMRLAANREELTNARDSAHLSIEGALQAISSSASEGEEWQEKDGVESKRETFTDGSSRTTVRWVDPLPTELIPSREERAYRDFTTKAQFVADQLWELCMVTTARLEDLPQKNPLPGVLTAMEWRLVLGILEHNLDGVAAAAIDYYARADRGKSFDMREDLGYVLQHSQYADIRRIPEDIEILRRAEENFSALAKALAEGLRNGASFAEEEIDG